MVFSFTPYMCVYTIYMCCLMLKWYFFSYFGTENVVVSTLISVVLCTQNYFVESVSFCLGRARVKIHPRFLTYVYLHLTPYYLLPLNLPIPTPSLHLLLFNEVPMLHIIRSLSMSVSGMKWWFVISIYCFNVNMGF